MLYRGVLPQDLPNAAWILGYVNASWTLKAELSAAYLCRLLAHMDERRLVVVVARDHTGCRSADSVMSMLDAGYIRRGDAQLPRQGERTPWRMTHAWRIDRQQLLEAPFDDGWLRFEARSGTRAGAPRGEAVGVMLQFGHDDARTWRFSRPGKA